MKLLIISLALVAASQSALARPDQTVDDLNLIDLRDDAATVERTYNYPGLGGGEQPNPDCLILVLGSDRFAQPENGIEQLKDAISVFDGDEILFPSGGQRDLNTLEPKIEGQILAYYVADLGKFLTGLRVQAKNGQSLKSVVEGIGFTGPVALQVVRGCRVLTPAL